MFKSNNHQEVRKAKSFVNKLEMKDKNNISNNNNNISNNNSNKNDNIMEVANTTNKGNFF